MGFIKATDTKGSQKSEIGVWIKTPSGKKVLNIIGEVEKLKRDRRRRRSSDFITLMTISREPRFVVSYNLSTHKLNLVFRGGVHFAYTPLDSEVLLKLLSVSYMHKAYSNHKFSGNVIIASPEEMPVIQWHVGEMLKKIKLARKERYKRWNARRRRKFGPQAKLKRRKV